MDETTDHIQALEQRLRNDDTEALGALFEIHKDRLWRLLQFRMDARLKQRVDADDILQEAFMDANKRIARFHEDAFDSSFLWLRLITLQTLLDVHRRHLCTQKRDARKDIAIGHKAYANATSISLAAHLVGNATSPSQAAIREERLVLVREAIEKMEPIDQEILALRHFEELGNNEVAQVLGIEVKAASIRYVRALKRLKDILSDAGVV